jgi:hypothetical protein
MRKKPISQLEARVYEFQSCFTTIYVIAFNAYHASLSFRKHSRPAFKILVESGLRGIGDDVWQGKCDYLHPISHYRLMRSRPLKDLDLKKVLLDCAYVGTIKEPEIISNKPKLLEKGVISIKDFQKAVKKYQKGNSRASSEVPGAKKGSIKR